MFGERVPYSFGDSLLSYPFDIVSSFYLGSAGQLLTGLGGIYDFATSNEELNPVTRGGLYLQNNVRKGSFASQVRRGQAKEYEDFERKRGSIAAATMYPREASLRASEFVLPALFELGAGMVGGRVAGPVGIPVGAIGTATALQMGQTYANNIDSQEEKDKRASNVTRQGVTSFTANFLGSVPYKFVPHKYKLPVWLATEVIEGSASMLAEYPSSGGMTREYAEQLRNEAKVREDERKKLEEERVKQEREIERERARREEERRNREIVDENGRRIYRVGNNWVPYKFTPGR